MIIFCDISETETFLFTLKFFQSIKKNIFTTAAFAFASRKKNKKDRFWKVVSSINLKRRSK